MTRSPSCAWSICSPVFRAARRCACGTWWTALNADYVDWSFSRSVVIAAIVQLQANWMADYRNVDGIRLEDGAAGSRACEIEDSSRVDPWILRQAERLACACTERLRAFAVEEGAIP